MPAVCATSPRAFARGAGRAAERCRGSSPHARAPARAPRSLARQTL